MFNCVIRIPHECFTSRHFFGVARLLVHAETAAVNIDHEWAETTLLSCLGCRTRSITNA